VNPDPFLARGNRVSAVLGLAALSFCAAGAHASPLELLSRIALHPSDPNIIVLSYEEGGQGLLYSRDGGQHFALRCGGSINPSFTHNGRPIALGGDGRLLIGFFTGMTQDDGSGCGWNEPMAALSGVQVADFAPHPADPRVTFLATANPSQGQRTGVFRRDADGSIESIGVSDTGSSGSAEFYATRLAVVALPGGGLRFYESGGRAISADEFVPVLRSSDDLAATWTSHVVSGIDAGRLLLLAVDPTHPDRLLLGIDREQGPDEVLYSPDGGATSTPYLEPFDLGGASVAPDGRWWVADRGGANELSEPGALWSGASFGAAPEKLAGYGVRCLAYRPDDDRLFACRRSEFGTISAHGEFMLRMRFTDVEDFVACPGEDLALTCKEQLCKNWCGPLQFSESPLCDAYDDETPLCGVAARGYARAMTGPGPAESTAPPNGAAVAGSAPGPPGPAAGCQLGSLAARAAGRSTPARLLLALAAALYIGRRQLRFRRHRGTRSAPDCCNRPRTAGH
jgi:hypothetical protein